MSKVCFLGLDNLPILAREYNHLGVGGAQLQMTLIAKALVKDGHDVSMVVSDYGQPDGKVWDGITTYKAFKPDAGLPVVRFIHPRWTLTWSALARANADVYFTSCAGMHVGLLAMFCRHLGKGFVFRLAHDHDADPKRVLIRLWRDKKLYDYGLKRANSILCQNTTQQKALISNYALESLLIKSFVEPPVTEYSLQNRNIEILWVNNLRDIKRPDLALKLAKMLPNRRVHMVGGGQPGFQKMFDAIRAEVGTLGNLAFYGPVPYHEVGDLFDRAKVFINTSDSEGFPNTYLQSWRRGVPVVALFDPDGLIHREGLGYAVRDMEGMQWAVERLLSDDAEWLKMSTRCRAYMESNHGDELVREPYLRAIDQARLARRRV